jgi:hypothetical protein
MCVKGFPINKNKDLIVSYNIIGFIANLKNNNIMRGKKFDREHLVMKIAELRIEGKSTHFIIEFLKENMGVCVTTAYEVLKDAQVYITNMTNKDLEKAYSEAIQQIEQKMSGISDKKVWLQYRAELNKLQGLYAAQKIEHSGKLEITGIDVVDAIRVEENKPEEDNGKTKD